jgi:hypothetical protein
MYATAGITGFKSGLLAEPNMVKFSTGWCPQVTIYLLDHKRNKKRLLVSNLNNQ